MPAHTASNASTLTISANRSRVQTVKTDVDAAQSCIRQFTRESREQKSICRHCEIAHALNRHNRAHDLDNVAAQERFTTRQPNLCNP
jgi:hypothetical protein